MSISSCAFKCKFFFSFSFALHVDSIQDTRSRSIFHLPFPHLRLFGQSDLFVRYNKKYSIQNIFNYLALVPWLSSLLIHIFCCCCCYWYGTVDAAIGPVDGVASYSHNSSFFYLFSNVLLITIMDEWIL